MLGAKDGAGERPWTGSQHSRLMPHYAGLWSAPPIEGEFRSEGLPTALMIQEFPRPPHGH